MKFLSSFSHKLNGCMLWRIAFCLLLVVVHCSHAFFFVTSKSVVARAPVPHVYNANPMPFVGKGNVCSSSSSSYLSTPTTTSLSMGLMDDVGKFLKRFTTKATASHILMRGGAEAEFKLQDMKAEINDSPVKFAQYAAQYSECPSSRNGGSLGEFGPGAMVKEFDTVVFNEAVGKVHGPIQTQFGYHLIYIADRTE